MSLDKLLPQTVLLTQANSLSSNATCFPQSTEILIRLDGLGARTVGYGTPGCVIAEATLTEHLSACACAYMGKHFVCLSSGPLIAL